MAFSTSYIAVCFVHSGASCNQFSTFLLGIMKPLGVYFFSFSKLISKDFLPFVYFLTIFVLSLLISASRFQIAEYISCCRVGCKLA